MVRPRKALLLTGAGFSRPFGGYLASEMWALVFRQKEVRASETLRKRMLAELNFERVYEEALLSSGVNAEEKQGFTEAVWRAYSQMHTEMSSQQNRAPAYALIRAFVSRFMSQDKHERGFVFTLNQDFLVESKQSTDVPVFLPGLGLPPSDPENLVLPGAEAVNAAREAFSKEHGVRLAYVKLHGSFNWRRDDGNRALVIGANKSKLLSDEPLLNWYQELFQQVLNEPERSLLVIGYSFRDPHINETILKAVHDAGLKLFVMSPMTPEDFKESLCDKRRPNFVGFAGPGDELWRSLYGYYRGSVEDYYISNEMQLPPQGQALFQDLGLAVR